MRALIAAGEVGTASTTSPTAASPLRWPRWRWRSGIGAEIAPPPGADPAAAFFGEDQGRYLLAVAPDLAAGVMRQIGAAGLRVARIGRSGGSELKLGRARAIPVATLQAAHEAWFPRFMGS